MRRRLRISAFVAALGLGVLMACSSGDNQSSQSADATTQSSPTSAAVNEALNVVEWRAANAMLIQTAEIIRSGEWQQGDTEVLPNRWCIDTALQKAFDEGDYTIVDFNYAREALSQTLQVPREPIALDNDPLSVPYWGRDFMNWNDAPGRTEQEVLKALDDAANLASQKEAEAKTLNIPG
jgi:hypothetical protein